MSPDPSRGEPGAPESVATASDRLTEALVSGDTSRTQQRLYRSLLGTVAGLAAEGAEVIDLKVADSALAEMA
ncbi:MAG TPA: hypothetical protein VIC86_00835, partial [Acidimicrobiales bacterium]